jgi:hypothetical protein
MITIPFSHGILEIQRGCKVHKRFNTMSGNIDENFTSSLIQASSGTRGDEGASLKKFIPSIVMTAVRISQLTGSPQQH